jgi:4-diphosphocytidyl-2-C-methyl-D-erythritol kinase
VSGSPDAGREFAEPAYAKVNLTLRVVGRRADGYHEIESLVCFADVGDRLTLRPGPGLKLEVDGPRAAGSGAPAQNLVLKAARALAERVGGLTGGQFTLAKQLPAGAGLGGGSADAAAALRLLARANNLSLADTRFAAAALATGADVPVCLDQQPRFMRGLGEMLAPPLKLPRLPAVLVFPGVPLATKDVFTAFRAGERDHAALAAMPTRNGEIEALALIDWLKPHGNDLEAAAIARLPVIAELLEALRAQPDCRLARMSGSGSACFAIFSSQQSAAAAARALATRAGWWVEATSLGG